MADLSVRVDSAVMTAGSLADPTMVNHLTLLLTWDASLDEISQHSAAMVVTEDQRDSEDPEGPAASEGPEIPEGPEGLEIPEIPEDLEGRGMLTNPRGKAAAMEMYKDSSITGWGYKMLWGFGRKNVVLLLGIHTHMEKSANCIL
jgi:hypothetical protein